MLMPSKIVTPSDSIIFISKFVLEKVAVRSMSFDSLYESVSKSYPKELPMEKFLLSINFLFVIGKLEEADEIIKATF
ncbi:ABC-three component system middle component 6 [Vibrio parahaemolyticus]|nr:hypothetical protein BTO03_23025 [Vibrio parahaemolyticus]TOA30651.1 hypothetical protein CGK28_24765 [Vibrio parahaemolyticus]TOH43084.1 hypothetical protein CGI82_02855 [Vibrio parahaemolyticus]